MDDSRFLVMQSIILERQKDPLKWIHRHASSLRQIHVDNPQFTSFSDLFFEFRKRFPEQKFFC